LSYLSNKVVAYHFCQSDNLSTCMVGDFVHSLAAQMSQSPALLPYFHLVKFYWKVLSHVYNQNSTYFQINSDKELQKFLSISGCTTDPSRAFLLGIINPLKSLHLKGEISTHSNFIIVIDGLCEAEGHKGDYGDTITSFLTKHAMEFPQWLKIICTVETSNQKITNLLPFLEIR